MLENRGGGVERVEGRWITASSKDSTKAKRKVVEMGKDNRETEKYGRRC